MLTRRDLLKRSGALGLAGGIAPGFATPMLLWQARVDRGSAEGAPASAPVDRTLVILQLAGGNDDLNMAVPYTDATYLSARSTLRVEPSTAIRLDSRLGLNPVMGNLKRIWDQKQLALIEGVGYPDPQYSHFDAMTIWQTAAPKGEFNDGWMGRYFTQTGAQSSSSFAGVAIGGSVPPMLQANGVMLPSLQNPANYKMSLDPRDAAARLEAWKDLQDAEQARSKYLPLIGSASIGAWQSTEALGRAVQTYQPAVTYGRDSLATNLRLLATIIVNQPGTKVAYTTVSGFDTHAQQRGAQDTLLEILSDALTNFQQDLNAHGKSQDVLLVTWTEFGRRVKENGSQGTDHGDGGTMLAMGGSVRGGIYGEPPDLSRLDGNGSQRWTTDFRSVYATLLEEWLGVESSDILGDRFDHVGFLTS
jgi:uncharacterized protein (DUF1501 family)